MTASQSKPRRRLSTSTVKRGAGSGVLTADLRVGSQTKIICCGHRYGNHLGLQRREDCHTQAWCVPPTLTGRNQGWHTKILKFSTCPPMLSFGRAWVMHELLTRGCDSRASSSLSWGSNLVPPELSPAHFLPSPT